MNNEFYTEKETALILGYKAKTSVKQFRNVIRTMQISNRWYYNKEDVLELADEERKEVARDIETDFEFVDIDLNLYVSLKDAIEITGLSRQRIYQLVEDDRIETVVFDGFMLFSRKDLKRNGR